MEQHPRLSFWGRLYVSAVVGLGGATIVYSVYQLHSRPIGWNWFILALLTLLSGSAPVQISTLLSPLIAFTITYFLLNSWLIALAIWFETAHSPVTIWKNNFAWLSLNYFGGASVAALLVTYTRNLDYTYIAFVIPLL